MINFHSDLGYAIWCQRGQCYRCKFKGCECPHHIDPNLTPDTEILAICKENSVARGWMGAKCQMGKHTVCRKTGCACKCHSAGAEGVTKIVKEEAPIASEEHVLELQERVYAVSADFQVLGEGIKAVVEAKSQVIEHAKAELANSITEFDKRLATMEKAKKLEIKIPGKAKPIEVGISHRTFPELVELVAMAARPVYMVGPAGGGKTEAARMACAAIGLDPKTKFFPQAVGMQTTQSQLIGYVDAHGGCVHSQAYLACTQGGIWFLDEVDAANPGVMTIANAILANRFVNFGCNCGVIERHKDTRFVVAANTFGKGADHLYVGRNQLDAATLNRFVWLNWDYDWDLTRQIAGDIEGFTTYIERLSECAAELKLRVIIGPRQAIYGCEMLAAGKNRQRVEELVLWAAIDLDDRRKILATMERKYPAPPKFPCVKCGVEFMSKVDFDNEAIHACVVKLEETSEPDMGEVIGTTPQYPDGSKAQFTHCPKCSSDQITNNINWNHKQQQANQKPYPDYKCNACGWHTWPKDYVWPKNGSGGTGYWN